MTDRDDQERDALLESETASEDRFLEIRRRFREAADAVQTLYADAADDFRFAFVPGCQWDAHMSELRGKRPKYEFNYLRQTIKQVLNDNRQNTPTIKVRPVEDSDTDLAELRQGIIRNIESRSGADTAYDWGALYAISAGFGCWEVSTEYVADDTFDQDICIKRIENPFSVFFDPSARELDKSDGRFAFKIEQIPKSEFRRRYPDAEVKSFDSGMPAGLYYDGWYDRETVRVAQYWAKHRELKWIYKLSDGRVVDGEGFDLIADVAANPPLDPMTGQPAYPPITIAERREVQYDRITVEVLSGDQTLEGPTDWAGKYIPIVPCWGDILSVDGQDLWYGMVRPSRDAQTLINFSQSNLVEVVASQPRAPYMVTDKMLEGHEEEWSRLAVDNPPALRYTPDPSAPGVGPQRQAPPQMAGGWFDLARQNVENLKSTSGIHDASLGRQSNETSGRAIMARQHEGDVATYDYTDNIAKAVAYTGVIVNDLIDKIYTSEREMRILGEGNEEKYVRINQPVQVPDPQSPQGFRWEKQNDLTVGRYDVTVTVGPSFTTQRMETLAALTDLARINGPMGAVFAYGILKYMDTPGISEFADIARKLLISQGIPLTPEEGDTPPAPPQPNPKDMASAQKDTAAAQKLAADAEGQQLENQARSAVLQQLQAQLAGPTMVPPDMPYLGGSQG